MKFKIVSDSSSNVPAMDGVDYAAVPLKIITQRREYVDGPDLDIPEMIAQLRDYDGRSGTSCPNVADWLGAFEGADCIFAVPITSRLSGSCAMAMQAREEYIDRHPSAKVFVLDSLSTGPEIQLLLEKLRELIAAGLSFEDIQARIQAYHRRTHLLFALESMKNLANNGRVGHGTAALAGILGIRLVGRASEQGTLEPLHKSRGRKRALRAIWEDMRSAGFSGGRVRIAHCLNPEAAQEMAALITAEGGQCDIQILPCAGLCSFYAEEGGLLVGFET